MSQHAQFSAVERALGCRTPNRTYDFSSGELGRTVRVASVLAKLSAESNKVASETARRGGKGAKRRGKEKHASCWADRTPGGEPLCSLAALWVASRRLPGTSQGVAVLWAGCIRRPV